METSPLHCLHSAAMLPRVPLDHNSKGWWVGMSVTVTYTEEDDQVFQAFAVGRAMRGDTTRSEELPGPAGHTALSSHGVVFALRSEEVVVFDALPHAEGCRVLCRLVAHSGRAAVHVHEHFEDGEVFYFDHAAFVALASRLGAVRAEALSVG